VESQSRSHTQYEAKLEALHQHANKLAEAKSIEEIAEHTADTLENTLGFTWASMSIVEDNHIKPMISVRSGSRTRKDKYPHPLENPGIRPRAVRTGESQLVNDTRKDADYVGTLMGDSNLSKLTEATRQILLRDREEGNMEWASLSELEVPVKIGKSVVAILGAESLELNAFNEQDGKLVEILASHVSSAIQRIRTREAIRELAYRLNNLQPGGCYLSESHERCFKAYAILSMEGVPGLSIVRDDPQRLMDNYGIKKEEIVLLSSRTFKGFETLEDLQAVSRRLSQFLLESGEGVVLLDGLEYLISRFGFEVVYSFVQEKRFDFLQSQAVLLVPMDMETIEGREKALLVSEFTLLE
jgi:putative methionine-R-sulfoxide reductase with GAF domain